MILGELKIGKHQAKCRSLPGPGVSILTSYGENPHYVKLPIFSEFMENSAKFMKNPQILTASGDFFSLEIRVNFGRP